MTYRPTCGIMGARLEERMDFAACPGTRCTLKNNCYRYRGYRSDLQSYIDVNPDVVAIGIGGIALIECKLFLNICHFDGHRLRRKE